MEERSLGGVAATSQPPSTPVKVSQSGAGNHQRSVGGQSRTLRQGGSGLRRVLPGLTHAVSMTKIIQDATPTLPLTSRVSDLATPFAGPSAKGPVASKARDMICFW